MYNVLVVDDQRIHRQYFEMAINTSSDYFLLYSADEAQTAEIYCAKGDIDLIIMDIVMKNGIDGIEAARKIKEDYPRIKILAVTSMADVQMIKRAKKAKIDSFWFKETDEHELKDIMDRTMNGESVYPKVMPQLKIGKITSLEFTEAEMAVLREMLTGATNKDIAERLNVEPSTIKTHISKMLKKTGCANRTDLAITAGMQGLIADKSRGTEQN